MEVMGVHRIGDLALGSEPPYRTMVYTSRGWLPLPRWFRAPAKPIILYSPQEQTADPVPNIRCPTTEPPSIPGPETVPSEVTVVVTLKEVEE